MLNKILWTATTLVAIASFAIGQSAMTKIQKSNGTVINPATEESVDRLRSAVTMSPLQVDVLTMPPVSVGASTYEQGIYYNQTNGAQRVIVDSMPPITSTTGTTPAQTLVTNTSGTDTKVGYASGHLFMPVLLMDVNRNDLEYHAQGEAYTAGHHAVPIIAYSRADGFHYIPDVNSLGAMLTRGSFTVLNFPSSQAVTGTFWQATQPVSFATMTVGVSSMVTHTVDIRNTVPVTFATMTVGVSSLVTSTMDVRTMPSVTVISMVTHTVDVRSTVTTTGVISQVLSMPTHSILMTDGTNRITLEQHLTDNEAGTDWGIPVESYNTGWNGAGWDRLRTVTTHTLGALVTSSTLSVLTTTPTGSVQGLMGVVSLGTNSGKTNIFKVGSLTSTATSEQLVTSAAYTTTAAKVFYMHGWSVQGTLSTLISSTTYTTFGTASIESPFGTKIFTVRLGEFGGKTKLEQFNFHEPVPIPHGTGIRCVTTPAQAGSRIYDCNIWGYEK